MLIFLSIFQVSVDSLGRFVGSVSPGAMILLHVSNLIYSIL
jgi:hypothetical protein